MALGENERMERKDTDKFLYNINTVIMHSSLDSMHQALPGSVILGKCADNNVDKTLPSLPNSRMEISLIFLIKIGKNSQSTTKDMRCLVEVPFCP